MLLTKCIPRYSCKLEFAFHLPRSFANAVAEKKSIVSAKREVGSNKLLKPRGIAKEKCQAGPQFHQFLPKRTQSVRLGIGFCSQLRAHLFCTKANDKKMDSKVTIPSPAPATLLSSLTDESVKSLMDNIDAVMFDCDGVIWHGMDPIESAQALVIKLRAMGKKVFFITNNSNRTRAEFLEKFNNLGFQATVDEIVGTAYLTALYLKELKFNKKVYVVGPLGVTQELEAVGIQSLPLGPDAVAPDQLRWSQKDFENVELDPEVGAVVVAFDHHFSYPKMLKAASYLNNKECLFIATNTDEQFPGTNNVVYPGTGCFVNAVKTAAAREPIIMGKPERFPFELLKKIHNLKPSRVLMVGDRGNTDILFGRNCGLQTLLVLTGVTTLELMHQWEQSSDAEEKLCVPDFYLSNVNEFYKLLHSL